MVKKDRYAQAMAKLERAKGLVASVRETAEEQSRKVQRGITAGASAFLLGAAEKNATAHSTALPTIAGMEPSLLYPIVGYVAAELLGGRTAEIIEDASLGLICAHGYKVGSR